MVEMYKDIMSTYMISEYVQNTDVWNIDPKNSNYFKPLSSIYIGIKAENNLVSLNDNSKLIFRQTCLKFLISICDNISRRFDFSDKFLQLLIALHPKHIQIYDSLLPLMNNSQRLTSNDENMLQLIDDQWRHLKSHLQDFDVEVDPEDFWNTIKLFRNDVGDLMYDELAGYVFNCFIYPHSNASCERIFSKINLAKTKGRNALKTDTIKAILFTEEHLKKGCNVFEPTNKMLNLMSTKNLYDFKGTENYENGDTLM